MAKSLPMFPLGTVLFPHATLPLHIFEERYRALAETCLRADGRFGVVLIERGYEVGGGDARFGVGTVARIVEAARTPDGRYLLATVGTERFRIRKWLDDDPFPRADVDLIGEPKRVADRAGDRKVEVQRLLGRVLALSAELGESTAPVGAAQLADDPLRGVVRGGRGRAHRPARLATPARARRPRRPLRRARGAAGRRGRGARAAPRRRLTTLSSMEPDEARERLHAEQTRVEGLIGELRGELVSPEHRDGSELEDTQQDAASAASETFEREKDLSILEQLETELAELQAALERVDAGTYGTDEVTGEPIDPARLEALPTARTNIDTESGGAGH